jgi:acyl-CoA thioester hydrolase
MEKVFEYPITISPSDIDVIGHVNNIVYLRWVQEAAIAHWNSLTTEQMQKDYVWVVVRHEIDYLQSALPEDKLVAKTWIGHHAGAKSERFVNICDKNSEKVYAKVKTVWCLLDAKTKRPMRIGNDIITAFL